MGREVVSMKNRTIDHYPSFITRLKQFGIKHCQFLNSLKFLNGCGQGCFLVGLFAIAGFGVGVAIPFLYGDEDYTGPCVRAFGAFLAFQLAINWILMKTVNSYYSPSKHGTKPDYINAGENISEARYRLEYQNGNALLDQGQNNFQRKYANEGNVMYVATEYPTTANVVPNRTAFPYFSWTPCLRCNRIRPPRCHHCPSCNKCVLKRDHHCFVTGVCVGYFNLRFFAVFITWASVATIFGTVHALPYLYYEIWPHIRYFDIIFPIAIVRWLSGYLDFQKAFLAFTLWLLIGFLLWSVAFFMQVYKIVKTGLTSFELDFKFMMYDTRPFSGKLEAVFGPYWWLNFIVPLHFIYPPKDDPVNWPYMRA